MAFRCSLPGTTKGSERATGWSTPAAAPQPSRGRPGPRQSHQASPHAPQDSAPGPFRTLGKTCARVPRRRLHRACDLRTSISLRRTGRGGAGTQPGAEEAVPQREPHSHLPAPQPPALCPSTSRFRPASPGGHTQTPARRTWSRYLATGQPRWRRTGARRASGARARRRARCAAISTAASTSERGKGTEAPNRERPARGPPHPPPAPRGQALPRPGVCPAGGALPAGTDEPPRGQSTDARRGRAAAPTTAPAPAAGGTSPLPRRRGVGRAAARGRRGHSGADPGGAPASPPRPTAPGAGHGAPPPRRRARAPRQTAAGRPRAPRPGSPRPRAPAPHPPARAPPPALAAVVGPAGAQRHRDEIPMRRRRRRRRRVHDRGGGGPAHGRRQEAGLGEGPGASRVRHPRAAIAAPSTPRPSRARPVRLRRAPLAPLRLRPPRGAPARACVYVLLRRRTTARAP